MTLTEFLLERVADHEAGIRYAIRCDESFPVDPVALLAECEARRLIVDEHYFMPRHESRDCGFEDGNCVTCRKQGPCATLRLLALPYSDHPDYREEWKP